MIFSGLVGSTPRVRGGDFRVSVEINHLCGIPENMYNLVVLCTGEYIFRGFQGFFGKLEFSEIVC